jgi:predicted acetyltransferase
MEIRFASGDDLPLLAELNHRLIRDQRSSNPMSLAELETRMRGWLANEYRAALFTIESDLIGYALIRPSERGVYLRQFFVLRKHRRRGYGRQAIELLRRHVAPDQMLELDVLVNNAAAISFWRALGFQEHAVTYRLRSTS